MTLLHKITREAIQEFHEQSYENLLALWADLEAALQVVLTQPDKVQRFEKKMHELRQWQTELVSQDIDAALYLMFQLATTHTTGYSASHSLVCSTLGKVLAPHLNLSAKEEQALTLSAMTMNIGMTRLQDELAMQLDRPSAEQGRIIRAHAEIGHQMLQELGVQNPLWLETVLQHHTPPTERKSLSQLAPAQRITRILITIDRYAAMISPRKSRPGLSVAESFKTIISQHLASRDEVAQALAQTIGKYPPGTLVKLDNQEIAMVLRRSHKNNKLLIASVSDARGQQFKTFPLYFADTDGPRIVSGLPRTAINFFISRKTMITLGIFAAHHQYAA